MTWDRTIFEIIMLPETYDCPPEELIRPPIPDPMSEQEMRNDEFERLYRQRDAIERHPSGHAMKKTLRRIRYRIAQLEVDEQEALTQKGTPPS